MVAPAWATVGAAIVAAMAMAPSVRLKCFMATPK